MNYRNLMGQNPHFATVYSQQTAGLASFFIYGSYLFYFCKFLFYSIVLIDLFDFS